MAKDSKIDSLMIGLKFFVEGDPMKEVNKVLSGVQNAVNKTLTDGLKDALGTGTKAAAGKAATDGVLGTGTAWAAAAGITKNVVDKKVKTQFDKFVKPVIVAIVGSIIQRVISATVGAVQENTRENRRRFAVTQVSDLSLEYLAQSRPLEKMADLPEGTMETFAHQLDTWRNRMTLIGEQTGDLAQVQKVLTQVLGKQAAEGLTLSILKSRKEMPTEELVRIAIDNMQSLAPEAMRLIFEKLNLTPDERALYLFSGKGEEEWDGYVETIKRTVTVSESVNTSMTELNKTINKGMSGWSQFFDAVKTAGSYLSTPLINTWAAAGDIGSSIVNLFPKFAQGEGFEGIENIIRAIIFDSLLAFDLKGYRHSTTQAKYGDRNNATGRPLSRIEGEPPDGRSIIVDQILSDPRLNKDPPATSDGSGGAESGGTGRMRDGGTQININDGAVRIQMDSTDPQYAKNMILDVLQQSAAEYFEHGGTA